MAVRLAFLEAPTDEMSAVMQVPMFWPIISGHGDVEGDHAGGADGLEYAHRGGGALEQGGDRRSHGYAQKGIGEGGKHRLELRKILQRLHGGGHGVHADDSRPKPSTIWPTMRLCPPLMNM